MEWNGLVCLTIILRMNVDILEAICCRGCRGDERSTWHQGATRLNTPVWCRRWLTCAAAQRLWYCVHQQQLNTHTYTQTGCSLSNVPCTLVLFWLWCYIDCLRTKLLLRTVYWNPKVWKPNTHFDINYVCILSSAHCCKRHEKSTAPAVFQSLSFLQTSARPVVV